MPVIVVANPKGGAGKSTLATNIAGLYARGNTLLLKGRPRSELPRDVLPCFKHSIIDLDDERRGDAPPPPGVTARFTIFSIASGA